MADDLLELHERLAHVRPKIDAAAEASKGFLSEAVSTSVVSTNPDDHMDWNLYATVKAPVPVPFRADIGTIANELRAILDALACVLAVRHSGKAGRTYFPISKTYSVFDTDGRDKMKRLSPQDQLLIENWQPWGGGHPWLFKLHEADRVRKHQRLLASGVSPQMSVGGEGEGGSLHVPQSGGVIPEIGKPTLLAIAKNFEMTIHTTVQIVYMEPEALLNIAAIPLMRHSADVVGEILDAFN